MAVPLPLESSVLSELRVSELSSESEHLDSKWISIVDVQHERLLTSQKETGSFCGGARPVEQPRQEVSPELVRGRAQEACYPTAHRAGQPRPAPCCVSTNPPKERRERGSCFQF